MANVAVEIPRINEQFEQKQRIFLKYYVNCVTIVIMANVMRQHIFLIFLTIINKRELKLALFTRREVICFGRMVTIS